MNAPHGSPPAKRRAARIDRPRRPWLGAVLVAAAVLAAVAPLPASWVERAYANGLHPILQHALTRLTNPLPFALGDLVFAGALLVLPWIWIAGLRAGYRTGFTRAARAALVRSIVALAVGYLIFLALWGLNYRRVSLVQSLDYDPARVTSASARALAVRTIEALNADGAKAHAAPWPDEEALMGLLGPTFDEAALSAGDRQGIVPARPKTSLADAFLGASGTAGFTHPVTHEVVLDRTILDQEKPFLLAHEWGHLAGFANESEASFVGLLACSRSPSPAIRYSGWLALYEQLPEETLRDARASADAEPGADIALAGDSVPALAPFVKEDLRAIAERARLRRSPWISRVSSRTYDRFLKANRVEEGIASYGLVVRLVLAVRFERPWIPALRTDARARR